MNVGDYLVAKLEFEKDITCGDGIVGKFAIKKGEEFVICDIVGEQIEIRYDKGTLWFTTATEPKYFVENYRLYFYDACKMNRKLKLDKLNEKKM